MATSVRAKRASQADLATMLCVRPKIIDGWVDRGLPSRRSAAGRTFELEDVRDFIVARNLAAKHDLATSIDAIGLRFEASGRQVARWRSAGMPVVYCPVGRRGGLYSLKAIEAWVDEQDVTAVWGKNEQLTAGQRELLAAKAELLELKVLVDEAAFTAAADVEQFLRDISNDIYRMWGGAQMYHMSVRDAIVQIGHEEWAKAGLPC